MGIRTFGEVIINQELGTRCNSRDSHTISSPSGNDPRNGGSMIGEISSRVIGCEPVCPVQKIDAGAGRIRLQVFVLPERHRHLLWKQGFLCR